MWLIGLPINEARPHDKLPYRGAWLWVGAEMIHLMELPNPDPLTGRPEHGGRDRHACLAIRDVSKLKDILDRAGNMWGHLVVLLLCCRIHSGSRCPRLCFQAYPIPLVAQVGQLSSHGILMPTCSSLHRWTDGFLISSCMLVLQRLFENFLYGFWRSELLKILQSYMSGLVYIEKVMPLM